MWKVCKNKNKQRAAIITTHRVHHTHDPWVSWQQHQKRRTRARRKAGANIMWAGMVTARGCMQMCVFVNPNKMDFEMEWPMRKGLAQAKSGSGSQGRNTGAADPEPVHRRVGLRIPVYMILRYTLSHRRWSPVVDLRRRGLPCQQHDSREQTRSVDIQQRQDKEELEAFVLGV